MRAEKRRRFVLDGERFWDIESFYDEAVSVFTDGFSAFGRSIPAFGELLCGGHGRHAYGEAIEVVWTNFSKSRDELPAADLLALVEALCAGPRANRDVLLVIEP
ncbi:MAG TPA: barstar family protein [Candidatus Ruthenibacterium merdigallinarum]|nr:barstar family protein [Candidatus Ruthenibacterium merdigallinarum]